MYTNIARAHRFHWMIVYFRPTIGTKLFLKVGFFKNCSISGVFLVIDFLQIFVHLHGRHFKLLILFEELLKLVDGFIFSEKGMLESFFCAYTFFRIFLKKSSEQINSITCDTLIFFRLEVKFALFVFVENGVTTKYYKSDTFFRGKLPI
jgi:hypothetical protein